MGTFRLSPWNEYIIEHNKARLSYYLLSYSNP